MTDSVNEIDDRNRGALNRDPERLDRAVDDRERDEFYDAPDYDNMDFSEASLHKLHLLAPQARIDERHGLMHQRWANSKTNNGRRVTDLMGIGYRARHPNTIPKGFHLNTEKWQGKDVIMVDGEMILMEIPMKVYRKFQQSIQAKNNTIMADIQNKHGTVMNNPDLKLGHAGKFREVVNVTREDVEGISFND